MHLVYGISSWTNGYRSAARHIDNGLIAPLCGGAGRQASWEPEQGEPSCNRCKRQYEKLKAAGRVCRDCGTPLQDGQCWTCVREAARAAANDNPNEFF